MSSIGRQLALTEPWWTWTNARIRECIDRAQMRAWLPLVRKAMEENQHRRSGPASLTDLCKLLDRDLRNIQRLAKGTHALTGQLAIGLSAALGIPMCGFFPETRAWITVAGLLLCDGSLSRPEMEAYVRYRLAWPPFTSPHLHATTVEQIVTQMPEMFSTAPDVELAILKSADAIGGILEPLPRGRGR